MEGFLVTMDVEKAFDSLDHNFLISALEKYGFGKNFISWVKILLKNQESCVLNGGTTTKYFLIGRGARQSDPISAYLFILALQILFHLLRSTPEIKGLAQEHEFGCFYTMPIHKNYFKKQKYGIESV